MGREIEKIAIQRGHSICGKFTTSNPATKENLSECDVVIEFTVPHAAAKNIELCLESGKPVCVGTTGWYDELDSLSEKCENKNGAMLTATNFSLGVNITFFLNKILAKIMNNFPEYSTSITEIHHTKKLDAPSGTAISLAEGIIKHHNNFTDWKLKENAKLPSSLPITALREGLVPGTHLVEYSSSIDTLTLKHEAHNREGFALGAVLSAEWIIERKGVYTIEDMLNFEAYI